eukprot:scaffold167347_cov52-Prasinocladus_malaysianus.AAC.3
MAACRLHQPVMYPGHLLKGIVAAEHPGFDEVSGDVLGLYTPLQQHRHQFVRVGNLLRPVGAYRCEFSPVVHMSGRMLAVLGSSSHNGRLRFGVELQRAVELFGLRGGGNDSFQVFVWLLETGVAEPVDELVLGDSVVE